MGQRDRARAYRRSALAPVRQRNRGAAAGSRRPDHRLLRRRGGAGSRRGVGDRRAPAAPRHPDPAGRGRLHGQRVRAHAPPRLRRPTGTARRRRPHGPRARRMTGPSAQSGAPGHTVSYLATESALPRHLAINQLEQYPPAASVDAFLAGHEIPIVEGRSCTFLYRGEADEVHLIQRIIGLPGRLPMPRLPGTDLWYGVLDLPEGSRLDYQIEI